MKLPMFTPDDVLPPGDYDMTLDDLRRSHLATGENNPSETWDVSWRCALVTNLEVVARQLWQVGISNIFIDGSFVENKDHPNDIDGYFESDVRYFASHQLHRDLNALDPHKIWTWSPADRRIDANSAKRQLPMWHQYRVELYPHYPGLLSGLRDQFGNEMPFPAAFRLSRTAHRPKGIVRLMP